MKDFYHPDELQPKTTISDYLLMGLCATGYVFIVGVLIARFFYLI